MKLIIPDKFRGTLTAAEAAKAIAEGLGGDCLCLPMADGGEGTVQALPHEHVLESASFVGHSCSDISCLPLVRRSSYNFGKAISHAVKSEGKRIIAGIGGTATADGGAGLLQALGGIFLDNSGNIIDEPISPEIIPLIGHINLDNIDTDLLRAKLLVLADVEAGLTNGKLSALDFLSQKGAMGADHTIIKESLLHLHRLLGGSSPFDGAGGGIGYALASVLQCRTLPGAQYILDHLPVDWDKVSLVATGEGCIDSQSICGKVIGCILRKCAILQIPVVAFGGKISAEINDPRCIEVSPPGAPLPTPDSAYMLLRDAAKKWAKKSTIFSY